jgi:membrane-associated phospholipid phosphatase
VESLSSRGLASPGGSLSWILDGCGESTFGFMSTASIVLIPLVGWARIELRHHSLAQVVTGSLLAASMLVVVFYLFGLL